LVQGIIQIAGQVTLTLLAYGVAHSFISKKFVKQLHILVETLNYLL
jgi:hypothetical protein